MGTISNKSEWLVTRPHQWELSNYCLLYAGAVDGVVSSLKLTHEEEEEEEEDGRSGSTARQRRWDEMREKGEDEDNRRSLSSAEAPFSLPAPPLAEMRRDQDVHCVISSLPLSLPFLSLGQQTCITQTFLSLPFLPLFLPIVSLSLLSNVPKYILFHPLPIDTIVVAIVAAQINKAATGIVPVDRFSQSQSAHDENSISRSHSETKEKEKKQQRRRRRRRRKRSPIVSMMYRLLCFAQQQQQQQHERIYQQQQQQREKTKKGHWVRRRRTATGDEVSQRFSLSLSPI